MNLKVLLPFGMFTEQHGVLRIVAETRVGSFGILPRRLDCVASIEPGILTYEIDMGTEVYIAVDEGILIKTGSEVVVSVRQALAGADLSELRQAVAQQFLSRTEHEQSMRAVLAKMESDFVRRMALLHND
jgi:F-type H+-transporting ATPase subunit epsilon